jgi:hypothetical protein
VIAELGLTPEQRDRLRTIEDETLLGWMRGSRGATLKGEAGPVAGTRDRPARERIAAVLTDEQLRRWRAMTGEELKVPIPPFPLPPPAVAAPSTRPR